MNFPGHVLFSSAHTMQAVVSKLQGHSHNKTRRVLITMKIFEENSALLSSSKLLIPLPPTWELDALPTGSYKTSRLLNP